MSHLYHELDVCSAKLVTTVMFPSAPFHIVKKGDSDNHTSPVLRGGLSSCSGHASMCWFTTLHPAYEWCNFLSIQLSTMHRDYLSMKQTPEP